METRSMLGHLHTVQGQFDQAREHYERALPMLEKALGSDHLKVAMALGELGYVLLKLERLDEARAHLERSLEIVEKTPGAKTHYRALALAYVGRVCHAQGKNDEARKHLERGLAILEKEQGTELSQLVHVMTLTWLGEVLLDENESEEALVLLERAVERVEQGPPAPPYGGEPEYETEPRFALARALLKTGKDKKRAIELAKRAHAEYLKAGEGFARDRAAVEVWLAKHGGGK
jgi:tetratricopeptide (TPR) repeat protein